jgi:hypothetical protein
LAKLRVEIYTIRVVLSSSFYGPLKINGGLSMNIKARRTTPELSRLAKLATSPRALAPTAHAAHRHPTIDEITKGLDVERADALRRHYLQEKQAEREAYPKPLPMFRPYKPPPPPFKSWREVNAILVPTAATGISPDEDLPEYVRRRWPTVTSKEHGVIETLMRAHHDIEDHTVRVYLGLRRGSVPRAEW